MTMTIDRFKVKVLEDSGFVEFGGGSDFTGYCLPTDADTVFYLFEDGRWEYHNLKLQPSDESKYATKQGTDARSLRAAVATY